MANFTMCSGVRCYKALYKDIFDFYEGCYTYKLLEDVR